MLRQLDWLRARGEVVFAELELAKWQPAVMLRVSRSSPERTALLAGREGKWYVKSSSPVRRRFSHAGPSCHVDPGRQCGWVVELINKGDGF